MISDRCCATAVARAGRRSRSGRDRLHKRVDAEDVDHSFHIVGQHLQAHLGFNLFEVLVRKWVLPIHALSVPNGCSTVCRRIVMASGMWSSLACILSSTLSRSQRFRRLILSACSEACRSQPRKFAIAAHRGCAQYWVCSARLSRAHAKRVHSPHHPRPNRSCVIPRRAGAVLLPLVQGLGNPPPALL